MDRPSTGRAKRMVLVSALLVSLVSAGVAAWIDDGQGNLAEARPPWMDYAADQ